MASVDHAWYLGERMVNYHIGTTSRRVPHPPPLDMFWVRDNVGPTLEEALIGTDHRLYLESEDVSSPT